MAHIDTLKYYESLIKAGNNELEAKAHIYNLNDAISDLITKDDLHKELGRMEDKIITQIGSQINTIKTLGWAMFVGLLVPLLKVAFWP